ncbi:hypothetical protein GQ602_006171 [Ophiocordyceps camponoti-floridani]|uniref:Uncharacterized protein n=1 Tax=Ophiocordyceps camponoti-floridani TaxID=2030778 RepID=A0A8H4Q2R6_9HYPO|nr:hypothetical protein GQ602_006171 [Ophiocordyceps camponoti-floridani]
MMKPSPTAWWKCQVESDPKLKSDNKEDYCRSDNYWRLRYLDFKHKYCEDPDQKYKGNYYEASHDIENIWAARKDQMKI